MVHICGPGGIGKSTLLREVARHARDRGISVLAIDGRELGPGCRTGALGPAPGALGTALREAGRHDRLLVLLDSYERMSAPDSQLRHELLPELPDQALVLIAGRGTTGPGWFSGGWEAVTARLDPAGLSRAEARRLLAARGLTDSRVSAIIDRAAGSPLALALAAGAATADSGLERVQRTRPARHPEVAAQPPGGNRAARGAPVGARHCRSGQDNDAELLRAVPPARTRRPATCGGGDQLMMIDRAHLAENPLLRWGFGWDGNVSFRIDSVRPGDADRVGPDRGPSLTVRPRPISFPGAGSGRVPIGLARRLAAGCPSDWPAG